MSGGASVYQPKNPIAKWIETRLPILSLAHSSLIVFPVPRNLNYWWAFGSMFFLAVYIHMLRGLYYGSYKAPRELIWILGVVIYFLMMMTAFMGYVLPWGQMSF